MFCTLQAIQGRRMPLEDVGCHKNFKIAREAFLIYHKLYPVRAICIFGLVVLPFFEVLEESLALNRLKNAKIHVCGRASELQKEMAFLIECQLHIFHPKISRTKRSYWFSGTFEAPSRIHQIVLSMF